MLMEKLILLMEIVPKQIKMLNIDVDNSHPDYG